jgi:hypothetical protein
MLINNKTILSSQQPPAPVIPLPVPKKELSKEEKQLVEFIAKLLVQNPNNK